MFENVFLPHSSVVGELLCSARICGRNRVFSKPKGVLFSNGTSIAFLHLEALFRIPHETNSDYFSETLETSPYDFYSTCPSF